MGDQLAMDYVRQRKKKREEEAPALAMDYVRQRTQRMAPQPAPVEPAEPAPEGGSVNPPPNPPPILPQPAPVPEPAPELSPSSNVAFRFRGATRGLTPEEGAGEAIHTFFGGDPIEGGFGEAPVMPPAKTIRHLLPVEKGESEQDYLKRLEKKQPIQVDALRRFDEMRSNRIADSAMKIAVLGGDALIAATEGFEDQIALGLSDDEVEGIANDIEKMVAVFRDKDLVKPLEAGFRTDATGTQPTYAGGEPIRLEDFNKEQQRVFRMAVRRFNKPEDRNWLENMAFGAARGAGRTLRALRFLGQSGKLLLGGDDSANPLQRLAVEESGVAEAEAADPTGLAGEVGGIGQFAATAAVGGIPAIAAAEAPGIAVKLDKAGVDPLIAAPAAAFGAVFKAGLEKAQLSSITGGGKVGAWLAEKMPGVIAKTFAGFAGRLTEQVAEEGLQEASEDIVVAAAKAADPAIRTPEAKAVIEQATNTFFETVRSSGGAFAILAALGVPVDIASNVKGRKADVKARPEAAPRGLIAEGPQAPIPAGEAAANVDKFVEKRDARVKAERKKARLGKKAKAALGGVKARAVAEAGRVKRKEAITDAAKAVAEKGPVEARKLRADQSIREAQFDLVAKKREGAPKSAVESARRRVEAVKRAAVIEQSVEVAKQVLRDAGIEVAAQAKAEALAAQPSRMGEPFPQQAKAEKQAKIPVPSTPRGKRLLTQTRRNLAQDQAGDLQAKLAALDTLIEGHVAEVAAFRESGDTATADALQKRVDWAAGEMTNLKDALGRNRPVQAEVAQKPAPKKKPSLKAPKVTAKAQLMPAVPDVAVEAAQGRVDLPVVKAAKKAKKPKKKKKKLLEKPAVAKKASLKKAKAKTVRSPASAASIAARQARAIVRTAQKAQKGAMAAAVEAVGTPREADAFKAQATATATLTAAKKASAAATEKASKAKLVEMIRKSTKKKARSEKAYGELAEAVSGFGDVMRSRGVGVNPFLDPKAIAATTKVVIKLVKFGVAKFAEVADMLASQVALKSRREMKQSVAKIWDDLRKKPEYAHLDEPVDPIEKRRRLRATLKEKASPEIKAQVKRREPADAEVEQQRELQASAIADVEKRHGTKHAVAPGERASLKMSKAGKAARAVKRLFITDNANSETLIEHIFGKDSKVAKFLVTKARDAQDTSNKLMDEGRTIIRAALHKAGLDEKALAELSSVTRKDGNNAPTVSIQLTGGTLKATWGDLIQIVRLAGDKHYKAAMENGGGAFEDGKAVTINEKDVKAIAAAINKKNPKILGVIEDFNRYTRKTLGALFQEAKYLDIGTTIDLAGDYVPGRRQRLPLESRKAEANTPEQQEALFLDDLERLFKGKKTSKTKLKSSFGPAGRKKLGGESFAQARTGGNLPVAIGDFIAEQLNHTTQMINYVSKSRYARDANAILGNEDVVRAVTAGIADGKKMLGDISEDIRDFTQMGMSPQADVEQVANKILRNLGRAAIGAKPQIVMYQATSLMYGAAELGAKNIGSAIKRSVTKGARAEAKKEIAAWAPTLKARIDGTGSRIVSLGQGENTRHNIRSNLGLSAPLLDRLGYGPIHKVDSEVIVTLWMAAKDSAKADGLEGRQLMEETNRRARQAVARTQPDWGVLTSSKLQRLGRKHPFMRPLIMFSSQTVQVANMAMRAVDSWRRGEINTKQLMAATVPSLVLGPIAIEMMQKGVFWFYEAAAAMIAGDDGDEKKKKYERSWPAAITDTISRAFGGFIVPAKAGVLVKDAIQKGLSKGGSFGKSPRLGIGSQFVVDMWTLIANITNGVDRAVADKKVNVQRLIPQLVRAISGITGAPIGGVEQATRPLLRKALK